ncbi:peptidyl-tRNA hydrolase Pth2 [Candidatus Harpocratesius sp.]
MNGQANLLHKYKQAIILRTDLKMSTGKKVAQGCHASVVAVESAQKNHPGIYSGWKQEGQKKVVLKVSSEEELLLLFNQAKRASLPCSLIQDAGLTQIPPGTKTAVAIGPAFAREIDKLTSHLKLL